MSLHRYAIRLRETTASAAVLKCLRLWFPNQSLSQLRTTVQNHSYLYCSDQEKDPADGLQTLARLMEHLDKAHLEAELWEEWRITPSAPWQGRPICREELTHAIQQMRDIYREVLYDTEREVEGVVSPEAAADIEEEVSECFP